MTREDFINSIVYSWEEWESLERNTGYAKLVKYAEEHEPEILLAYRQYKLAKHTMSALVRDLSQRFNSETN